MISHQPAPDVELSDANGRDVWLSDFWRTRLLEAAETIRRATPEPAVRSA
ncbi:MAG TPA: hypothetical protein VMM78_01630 [Thermomicrobiales bacterium]|nr:hypothetical protein [Thermomicrobiales bacterium]